MPSAGDWCSELAVGRISADRAGHRPGCCGAAGLGGRLRVVRAASRRYPDRARHHGDLHPVGLDDPDLRRAEPDFLPGQAVLLRMSKYPAPRTQPPVLGTHQPAQVEHLRALSRLLDTAFVIPGTRYRFGLDALIGLVPGLGDAVSAVFSSYLVLQASRLGAPRSVVTRMIANIALDTLVGWVPILGDLFDVAWKSNVRNMALLEEHLQQPSAARAGSRRALVLLGGALLLLV